MANNQSTRGGRPPHRPRTSTAVRRQLRRQRRRRVLTSAVAIVVVAAVLLAVVLAVGTSKSASAGKPCVAVHGPLPKGAPTVPVRLGKPPTKLVKQDLKVGTGALVKTGQTLTVDYIGVACSTGKIFDSSYKTGKPATFPLNQVIPGWQQGLPGMKVGGERLLGIPPALGYGATGQGADIGPNETLWFVVTVHSAK